MRDETTSIFAFRPRNSDRRVEHAGRRHTECAGASRRAVASADDECLISAHRRAFRYPTRQPLYKKNIGENKTLGNFIFKVAEICLRRA